ncbi:MAG: DUF983 domain-containing protein [Alphaproteobacteria bacterium]|nr:DUF983 domain-containing protein [Alphaproteobacteria bacterium]
MTQPIIYGEADAPQKRPVWPAIGRGARGRCPNCARGKLFRRYLKVVDRCEVCAEEFFHHRADDAPPYITMLIVGHLAIGAMLHLEMTIEPDPRLYLWVILPAIVVVSLAILQPIKGAIVGLQWAHRMHGFDPENADELSA